MPDPFDDAPGTGDVVPIAGDSGAPVPEVEIDDPFEFFAELMGFDPSGEGAPPPLTFDDVPVTGGDVVPIAGDSSGPVDDLGSFGDDGSYVGPPPPDAGTAPAAPPPDESAYGPIDAAVDDLVDLTAPDGLEPPSPLFNLVLWLRSAPRWAFAALLALVLAVVVSIFAFGGGGSTTVAQTSAPATTSPATTTSATPTTTAPAPAPGPSVATLESDVTLDLSLGLLTGAPPDDLPLHFTVVVSASAPGEQTVRLAYTGPGLPSSETLRVAPGKSETRTYMVGCGNWTVAVVAIDGTPVNAKGNVNLENGAHHPCSAG